MYLKRRGGTNSGKERWNTVLAVDENERKNRRELPDYRHRPFKKSGGGSYGQRSRTNTFFEISNKNIGTRRPKFITRKRKQPSTEISRVTESRHCEKFRRSETIWDIAEAQSSKNCWRQRPENNQQPRSSSSISNRKRLGSPLNSETRFSSRTADSVASNLPSTSRSPSRKVRRITVHKRVVSPEPKKRNDKKRSDASLLSRQSPNTTVSNKGLKNDDNEQKLCDTKSAVIPSSTKHLKISDDTSRSCQDTRVKSTISCPNSSIDFKHLQTKEKKVADQQHEQNYKSAAYRTLGSNSRTKCGSKSSNGARISTRYRIEPESASRKKDAQIDNNGRRATKNSLAESKRKSTHSSRSSGMFTRLDSRVRTNSNVKRSESKLLPKADSEKEKKLESRPKKKAANTGNHSSTVIEENHRRCNQQKNERSGLLLSGLIKSDNNNINNSCVDTTKKREPGTEIFQQAGLSRQLCGEQLFGRVVQHVFTLQSVEALSDQEKQSQRTHIEKMMEAPGRHYRKSEQTNLLINLGMGSAFRPLSCQREMTIRRQLLKLPGFASSIHVQQWIPVKNPHKRNSQQMETLLEQALYNLKIW